MSHTLYPIKVCHLIKPKKCRKCPETGNDFEGQKLKAKGSINKSNDSHASSLVSSLVHSDKDLFCIFRISKIPEMAISLSYYGDGSTVYFINYLKNLD